VVVKKPIPFGKYDLLERINVGGMAEVFRAKAYGVEGFERLVAVKRILPNIAEDKDFITMFVDEAKIAVQLNHANIAQIFDLGVVDGSYFIALEHVHGRDLRAIFERCRHQGEPMPVAQACFIVMKLCEGLDYAHNKRDAMGRDMNLVHRDVSPQNILVSFDGEIKIIDFGIAKAAGKVGKTQQGILKGKFGYMSPEQVRGLPIDRRSDIFSTGIVLYELLTNERLFVGESDFSTLEKVRNVEILPPSTYNRKIPDELERIVLKTLTRDVDDRYANAIDLHDELQAFVYTAGEFYSRKDLAAWMKRTFAREIEEESAKFEQYRQAPGRTDGTRDTLDDRAAPQPSTQKVTQAHRKATIAMAAAPPPPQQPQNGRPRRTTLPPPPPPAALVTPPPKPVERAERRPEPALEWDEDELETQIYDQPGEPMPAVAAGAARKKTGAFVSAPTAPAVVGADSLDLAVKSGFVGPNAVETRPIGPPEKSPAPVRKPGRATSNGSALAAPSFPAPREPSMTARGTIVPEISVRRPPNPAKIWLVAGAVGIACIAVGGYWIFSGSSTPRPQPPVVAEAAPAAKAPEPPPAPLPVDPSSGFDITTDPPSGKVRLDGSEIGNAPLRVRSLLAGRHQLEVTAPGYQARAQEIVVEQGKALQLAVKLDKATTAAAMTVVKMTSTPSGAKVTLVDNGTKTALGVTPNEAKLDPAKKYEAIFELDGYQAATRPIGAGDTAVAVTLAKAGGPIVEPAPPPKEISAVPPPPPPPKRAAAPKPARPRHEAPPPPAPAPKREVAAAPREKPALIETRPSEARTETRSAPLPSAPATPAPSSPREPAAASAGAGHLTLGAKPPCTVLINGQDTGKTTPVKDLEVKSGTVSVTLVNGEFGIRESFSVTVAAGESKKIIKDFSDRLPK
jgi:serine/threonine protein kinase